VGSNTGSGLPCLFVVFNEDGSIFWKTKTINLIRSVALHPDGTFAAFSVFRGNFHIFHNPPE
jgi:hypothetical protein